MVTRNKCLRKVPAQKKLKIYSAMSSALKCFFKFMDLFFFQSEWFCEVLFDLTFPIGEAACLKNEN
jgi:hypothetical protein